MPSFFYNREVRGRLSLLLLLAGLVAARSRGSEPPPEPPLRVGPLPPVVELPPLPALRVVPLPPLARAAAPAPPARPRLGTFTLIFTSVALSTSLVLGLQQLAGGQQLLADSPAPTTIVAQGAEDGIDARALYQLVSGSILVVDASQRTGKDAPPNGEVEGTGFVIDDKRHVVTNFHVVKGTKKVWVTLPSGEREQALIAATDPSSDIAILEVEGKSPLGQPLRFASKPVQPGDPVVAIGNPLGLARTLSQGIVSSLGRSLTAPNDFQIQNVIQFDAPIDHGSSGGPLLNAAGEVIGVNTAIAAEKSAFGFAVPAAAAQRAVEDLLKLGKVEYAWLGVRTQTVTPGLAEALKLPARQGALLHELIAGGPAERGGLQGGKRIVKLAGVSYTADGDLIVEIDGKRVKNAAQLGGAISQRRPGEKVIVRLWRAGKLIRVTFELGARPAKP